MVEKYKYLCELEKLGLLKLGLKLGVVSPISVMSKTYYEYYLKEFKRTGSKMEAYCNGSDKFGISESYFMAIIAGRR